SSSTTSAPLARSLPASSTGRTRSASASLAPNAAHSSAVAAPMPPAAPVMRMVRPSRENAPGITSWLLLSALEAGRYHAAVHVCHALHPLLQPKRRVPAPATPLAAPIGR